MKMQVNPLTLEKVDPTRKLVFDQQKMKFVPLAKGERLLRNPVTFEQKIVREKCRLVFDWQRMKFIFLPKEKRLLQNPLTLEQVISNRLEFNPITGKFVPLERGEKLAFHPSRRKYIVLKANEKLKFDSQENRFRVFKVVPFSERIKGFWRRITEITKTIF